MKPLLRIYSIYVYLIFIVAFILFIPIILLLSQKRSLHQTALKVNTYWSRFFFHLIFIPVRYTFEEKLDKKKNYILCSNHFSYLDIPVVAGLPLPFKFIGKSSIARVPIFGYMFKKLHITVNRENVKSRGESLRRSLEALQNDFNVFFFPEGGILTKTPPEMVSFKDGAFRLALEQSVPIVPVTLPDNYKILPDDDSYLFRLKKCRVIIHKPIHPQEYGNDIERLKAAVRKVIEAELLKHRSEIVGAVG